MKARSEEVKIKITDIFKEGAELGHYFFENIFNEGVILQKPVLEVVVKQYDASPYCKENHLALIKLTKSISDTALDLCQIRIERLKRFEELLSQKRSRRR